MARIRANQAPILPAGVRLAKDGKYHWELDRKREDGTKFRKAGARKDPHTAIANYKAALEAFEAGSAAKGLTVGEWADYCLEHIYPVAPSARGRAYSLRTIAGYQMIVAFHIKPAIGSIQLAKLSPEHVDSLLRRIKAGVSTKKSVRNTLSNIYKQAQARGKIPHGFNPVRAVRLANAPAKRDQQGNVLADKRILTPAEEEKLLAVAKETWLYGGILLALRMGLRLGEVVALQWKHVDLKAKRLRVTEQIQRVSGKGLVTTDPKTYAGVRTIPIPPSVLQWLEAESLNGCSGYLIKNTLGKAVEPRKVSKLFTDLVMVAGLTGNQDEHGSALPDPTFHDLRSTFCTRMAQDYGVQPNTLIKLSGHSDITTLLSYYVRASDADLEQAMALVA